MHGLSAPVGNSGGIKYMPDTQTHDFIERLAYSNRASCEPFWDAIYRKAFPNMVNHMQCTGNTTSQRQGIDRLIHLSNGKTLYIDEKKRERDYPDILLEYISVDTTKTPGWIEKELMIDFLAYAFMPSLRVYLYPWPLLQRAWRGYKERWMIQYSPVQAKNRSYSTWSLPIPISVLQRAVSTAAIIDVSSELSDWRINQQEETR